MDIKVITPAVGAVVTGIDLRQSLAPETVAAIRAAVLDHGALFFREQDLDDDQMFAFMKNFGPLVTDPYSLAALQPPQERDTIIRMPTAANAKATAVWHIDSTLGAEPASLMALRALELPPSGGDTCFGSMIAPYEALSAPMQAFIDGLTAVHSAYKVLPLLAPEQTEYLQNDMRNVHPVVRVHPETGRKAIFVNELWTEKIVELSPYESERLLSLLWEHVKAPEFTMRWQWQVNDLALWDNRAFQHYAVRDYQGTRVLQKSLVKGDRPFGPTAAASPA